MFKRSYFVPVLPVVLPVPLPVSSSAKQHQINMITRFGRYVKEYFLPVLLPVSLQRLQRQSRPDRERSPGFVICTAGASAV